MPIQFRCQSCEQPVEVDDEAAHQMVVCPFCKNLSQAPATSDPTIHQAISEPVPQPASLQSSGVLPTAYVTTQPTAHAEQPQAPSATRLGRISGWLSLVCVGIVMVCFAVSIPTSMAVAQKHGPTPDTAVLMEEMQKELLNKPWLLVVNLIPLLMLPAGIILSLIALFTKARPMWPAIVALVFTAMLSMLMCSGFFSILGG